MTEILEPSNVNQWFQHQLEIRGTEVTEIEDIAEFVPSRNFWIKLKLMHTSTKEAFLVSFWRNPKDRIKSSKKVSAHGRNLDERMRFARATFSPELDAMIMMKEPTLLKLLENVEKGLPLYIVAIYPDGTAYWASAVDFYEFATRYGTYQNYARTADGMAWLPYRVPTGWMKRWSQPVFDYPTLML